MNTNNIVKPHKDTSYLDILYTETQAAGHLSVTIRAMQKWRLNGNGPKFVRISGRCIRYRKSDLINWVNNRIKQSTSEK